MTAISNCDTMFVETGSMQGEDRYILEISEDIANFFDEKRNVDTNIHIHFNGKTYWRQKLSFKDRKNYAPQWRVFLPKDFPAFNNQFYQYKWVRFDKEDGPQGTQYNLSVVDQNDPSADNWRDQARREGDLQTTGGGREYGFF